MLGILQFVNFYLPSNIALNNVGLPDCTLSAAGHAGHPASANAVEGKGLTQLPSSLSREATEDGLTWPFPTQGQGQPSLEL